MLEIITEGEPPEYMQRFAEPGLDYLGSAHILGAYNTASGTWKMTTEHQCQSGTCRKEMLGKQGIIVGCPACLAELDEWSCWLATMLDLLTGKFRQAQGEPAFLSGKETSSLRSGDPFRLSCSAPFKQSVG
jgi:hypothetical protein